MSIVYYAKFNINSNLKEVSKENKLKELILELAHKMETKSNEYEYIYKYEYKEQRIIDGEKTHIIKKDQEVYRFLDISKSGDELSPIITGKLLREKPEKIEVYNPEEHKIESAGINERAFSTTFMFDLKSETIVFTERNGLGRNQFIRGFESICEKILTDYNIKIILKEDPRSFVKKVKELTRVDEINIQIISPNFVEDDLGKKGSDPHCFRVLKRNNYNFT